MQHSDTVVAGRPQASRGLVAGMLLLLCVGGCNGAAGERLSDDQAADRLVARVRQDRTYGDWRSLRCLRFLVEGSTTTRVEIAVRQKHEPPCRGDPDVEPVVDRYRVDRDSGVITRYDGVGARYVQLATPKT